MIRLIVYIVISLILTAGAAWLISLPGVLTIDIAGYRLQPGLGLTFAALIALIILSIITWAIIRRFLEAPKRIARLNRDRRQRAGVEALSNGFIALEAGDVARARSLARDAQSRLPDNSAAQLLEARTELALGDMDAARRHYRALIANPRTALAALAGLFQQARAQGRNDTALTFARKAAALAPGLDWAQNAVFDDLTAHRDWAGALEHVSSQPAAKWQDREQRKRRQAVLHTAIAQQAEPTDPAAALTHALSALKLEPGFVPAALVAARIQIDRGEARKASSLLRRVWRTTGHPHIATLYAHTQPGSSAVARLKKLHQLIDGQPEDLQAACVLARAAIDAYEWAQAHNALANFSSRHPTQAVCLLMAEIEEGQNGDQGKAREWLARAVRAPRDPAWVADGVVSEDWAPVSPVTGKLDAFQWKVPLERALEKSPSLPAVAGQQTANQPAAPASALPATPAPANSTDSQNPG